MSLDPNELHRLKPLSIWGARFVAHALELGRNVLLSQLIPAGSRPSAFEQVGRQKANVSAQLVGGDRSGRCFFSWGDLNGGVGGGKNQGQKEIEAHRTAIAQSRGRQNARCRG
jgi:hypothetical protein